MDSSRCCEDILNISNGAFQCDYHHHHYYYCCCFVVFIVIIYQHGGDRVADFSADDYA